MSEHMSVRTDGGVLHVQFDRPEKRNALTQAMYATVNEALTQASNDEHCRVVVLSGSETCFTAGNDVKDFMAGGVSADSPVAQFLQLLSTFEKPLVAAVAGPAVGVGTTMLFHCDLVYATADAKLKTPFVDLALVPEAASSLLMTMYLGYQRAAGMLMLGEVLSATDAYAAGLVNQIIPQGELLATALQKAQQLASRPPAAVRLTKALMRKTHREAVAERLTEEGQLFFERLGSPEAMEAFTAFMEQRKPDFSSFT
ncbi:MAG: enoyl-CoA hydratase [Myxococcota bacterium]